MTSLNDLPQCHTRLPLRLVIDASLLRTIRLTFNEQGWLMIQAAPGSDHTTNGCHAGDVAVGGSGEDWEEATQIPGGEDEANAKTGAPNHPQEVAQTATMTYTAAPPGFTEADRGRFPPGWPTRDVVPPNTPVSQAQSPRPEPELEHENGGSSLRGEPAFVYRTQTGAERQ